jgi:nucleoside-diphosphate-sugar epimerase
MSRCVVTGATGFLGGALAAHLAAAGHEVACVVRPGSDRAALPAGVAVAEHDGTAAGMRAIVAGARPETVFHLASLFLAEHRPDDVDALVTSNVAFGTQLAEACAQHGVGRLVNAGTSWQSFEGPGYRPVNLYAATKQAFEDVLAYYADATPLRAITLRLFDTYGPSDPRRKLLRILRDAVRTGEPLAMSPGEQLLDLVHVDDVVAAFAAAADRLAAGAVAGHEVYGVSSGERLTLRELVALVGEVAGRPLEVEFGGRPYRAREVMRPWEPGAALPGWAPRVGLREGLAGYLAAGE